MKPETSVIYHQTPFTDARGNRQSVPVWKIQAKAPLSARILLLSARRRYLNLPLPPSPRLASAIRSLESATRFPTETPLKRILRYLNLDPLLVPLLLSGTLILPAAEGEECYRILDANRNIEILPAAAWMKCILSAQTHLADLKTATRVARRISTGRRVPARKAFFLPEKG